MTEKYNGWTNYETKECPDCGQKAEYRVCVGCGENAWVIDCGHHRQPAVIAVGRVNGSDSQNFYCSECAVRV